MVKFADSLIARLIGFANRYAIRLLIGYGFLLVLSAVSAVQFLSVNTDSSQMLAPHLDFQQKTQALNRDFPELKNAIVVVVRSEIGDAADRTASDLQKSLKDGPSIEDVFAPAVDPFFVTNGLLYQGVDELDSSLQRLNKSASLLASLRADPTLPTFWHALLTAEELADGAEFDRSFLDEFYRDVRVTIDARLNGRFSPLSWAKASEADEAEVAEALEDGDAEQTDAANVAEEGPVQRIVYVTPKLDFEALQPAKAAITALDDAIADLDPDLQSIVQVSITGDPALRFDELRSVTRGIGLSLLLSLGLVAILLWIAFRSAAHVAVTMIALVSALIITTGFAAIVFGALNLVSVAFVVLLVGLGLDYTIHVLAHIGDSKERDLRTRLLGLGHGIGGALLLSCVTTAIAFLSFVPTDFQGLAQLGGIGAAGVFVAFFLSVTLVPALISCVPWFHRHLINDATEANPETDKALGSNSPLPSKKSDQRLPLTHKLVSLAIVGGFGAALLVAPNVRFDADPIALRDPDAPSMVALGLLSERAETVPYRLSLLRTDPEKAIEDAAALEALPVIHKALTLDDLVPEAQDEKFELVDLAYPTLETIVSGEGLALVELPEGEAPIDAFISRLRSETERPDASNLAETLSQLKSRSPELLTQVESDLFLFFPDLISRIDQQLGVDEVTRENLPDSIKSRYVAEDGRWRIDIVPEGDVRDPKVLQDFVSAVESFDQQAAGSPLQIVKAGETVSGAIIQSLTVAGIGILFVAYLVLRRFSTVAAIFIPLAMAGIMTAAASVVFEIPFNYANVIVLPLLIGLGVDSGVHIGMRRDRIANSRALYETSTPRAVLFSGLTTIAAFATLSVSDHRGTASMGQMLAISITTTLMATILITPLLMDLFDKMIKRSEIPDKMDW
ncbi:MAG: MMPL family transporter [Pseudomonadota bacterium]